MNTAYFLSGLIVLALSVWITRFTPFLLFGKREKLPAWVEYLGKVLPAAMMGLLVIYCLKDVDYTRISGFAPAIISAALTAAVHIVRGNTILSILSGTLAYILLIRIF